MNKSSGFQHLLALATEAVEAQAYEHARSHLLHLFDLPLSFLQLTKVNNLAKKLASLEPEIKRRPLRLAILADSTTTHLRESLEPSLRIRGFKPVVYEAPFDTVEQEIFNPTSELYRFAPTHVLLFVGVHDYDLKLPAGASDEDSRTLVDDKMASLEALWATIGTHAPGVQIIQSTLASPPERILGHIEGRTGWSRSALISALNQRIRSGKHTVLDLDHLSSVFGKKKWFDRRFWFHSKHSFSMDALGLVNGEICRMLSAMCGASRKCLVLDLDNTLWGGVIGDDGLEGIDLGEGAAGEAFEDFQNYLKLLKDRGVILAVCSKNEESNARLPFDKHERMVLKGSDISCFVANWENKADNIRRIAADLDIGLDSLVFFDDNPAERKIVRDFLPEVYTVEVPEDPSEYVGALDSLGLFDVTNISKEDSERANYYVANASRNELKSKATSLDDYLKSLQMKCFVSRVTEATMERPLQLINKSNQFNLMTNRYSESMFRSLLATDGVEAYAYRLTDSFGDNGIICVTVLQRVKRDLEIRDWVMSCRVLSRGMEDCTINQIRAVARDGSQAVVGRYRRTAKNLLVENLLPRFGFPLVGESETEKTYRILTEDFPPFAHQIEVIHEY